MVVAPSATQTQVTALVPTSGASNANILASLGTTTERLAARYALEADDQQKSGRTAIARVLAAKTGPGIAAGQTIEVVANGGVKSRLDSLIETLKKTNTGRNPAFDRAIDRLRSGNVPDMVRGLRTARGLLPDGKGATGAALTDLMTLVANSTHYN